MIFRAYSGSYLVIAASLLCIPASAASARGDVAAAIAPPAARAAPPSSTLAEQIDSLLTARFEAIATLSAEDIRREALKDLSQFADLTVGGLLDASPSGEVRSQMEERLRPILAHHQHAIAAALAAMGERAESRYAPPTGAGRSRLADGP